MLFFINIPQLCFMFLSYKNYVSGFQFKKFKVIWNNFELFPINKSIIKILNNHINLSSKISNVKKIYLIFVSISDGGSLRVGDTVSLSYVDQNRSGIDPKKSVWQVVSDGLDFLNVGHVEMPSRAYISAFGFKGPDQQKPAGVLSGGERNRLNLALTLKIGGNVLLLDEPTNDLDVETLGSLENALLDFPGCAVVISHDRWFLDRVTTHILAWEGESRWFWFEGNFESYEKNKIERLGADAVRPHRATYRKLTRD